MQPTHGTIPRLRERQRLLRAKTDLHLVQAEVEEHEEEEAAPGFLQVCWPAVFGILLAIIVPQIHAKVLSAWGDVGERLVFPLVLLSGRPEFGFGEELSRNILQLMLYLQFPLFGLYASWNLSRRVKLSTTVVQIVFVNLITAFVLWLLTKPGATHGM